MLLLFALAGSVLVGGAGCGRYAVRADEKEFLADRIMQPDYDEMASMAAP